MEIKITKVSIPQDYSGKNQDRYFVEKIKSNQIFDIGNYSTFAEAYNKKLEVLSA